MRTAMIAVFASIALAVSPLRAQTPPPPAPENLAAARELVQLLRVTDQMKALLPMILQQLKPAIVQNRPDAEKAYDAIMPIVIDGTMARMTEFTDIVAGIYARNFSVAEIRDIIAFYRTPSGQAFIDRQPAIVRATLAASQQFMQTLAPDLKDRITEELRKRGIKAD